VDYGFQVAQNVFDGKEASECMTDVNLYSIGISATTSVITVGESTAANVGVKTTSTIVKVSQAANTPIGEVALMVKLH
jgi:hypothetical protein